MRLAAACLLALAALTCASPPPDDRCAVSIEAVDPESGRPAPALIRVTDAQGRAVGFDGLLDRGIGLDDKHPAHRWSVLPGRRTVRLPRERLTFEAFRGLDTETARVEADLAGHDRAEIKLAPRRFHDAAARGWRNANTHLHLQKITREESDRYLLEVPAADGLDALFVSHLERAEADREYITNRYTEADLKALSARAGVLFGNGEEHRHNFGGFEQGYGHVMLLNIRKLVQPVSIGPGIMKKGTDGIPLQRGIDEAKRDGATAIWCHNTFGLEDIPNWVTGRPHAQNIFDGDPSTHGSYKDTFYRYLNAGLRVPFSTGTDWFIYDFSRVYAQVPSLKTQRDWLEALEKGRTYITNGPLLEFTVDDLAPGETLRLERAGRVRVKARALGRVDFVRVELVRNGEVVHTADARRDGGHVASEFTIDLEIGSPSWLALRIPPAEKGSPQSELGGPLFAHTSPVYVEVAGRHVSDAAASKGLLEEVKRAQETIAKSALFADEHERAHVMEVYAAAAAVLEKGLK